MEKNKKIGQYRDVTPGVLWRMCAGISTVPNAHELFGTDDY